MFSKACKYGIKAVLYIASQSLQSNRTKIGDIVKYAGVPEAFTGKILGMLSKNGIVNSYTGPNGGFEINMTTMETTSIADIVSAIDGDTLFYGCALGLSECDEQHPCPMHESFAGIRNQLTETLQSTTVYEFAASFKEGYFLLKR